MEKTSIHCYNPHLVSNCLFPLTAWGPRPTVKAGQKTSTVAEKGQFEEPLHRCDTSTPPRRTPSSASSSPRSPTAGPSSLHTPPSKKQTWELRPDTWLEFTISEFFFCLFVLNITQLRLILKWSHCHTESKTRFYIDIIDRATTASSCNVVAY